MNCDTCYDDPKYTIQLTQKGFQGCPECTQPCSGCDGNGLFEGRSANEFGDAWVFLPLCFDCVGSGLERKPEYDNIRTYDPD